MSPRLREVLKSIEQHYDAKAWRHVKASMLNVRRAADSGTAPDPDAVRTVGAVVDCVVAVLLEEEERPRITPSQRSKLLAHDSDAALWAFVNRGELPPD